MATFSYNFDIAAWTYSVSTLHPDSPTVQRTYDSVDFDDGVQTEANHPDGTGRGHLHWMGAGDNIIGNCLSFDLGSTFTDMYVRYYAKFEAGMVFTPGYMKDIDLQQGPGNRIIFGHQNGVWQFINITNGSTYFGNGTMDWATLMGGTGSDGQWHRFEFHLKAGNGTGIGEIRIDGVDCGSQTGVVSDTTGLGWSKFNNFTNQSAIGAGGPYKVYFDELVVSLTTPV
jgi:hypothetical protein